MMNSRIDLHAQVVCGTTTGSVVFSPTSGWYAYPAIPRPKTRSRCQVPWNLFPAVDQSNNSLTTDRHPLSACTLGYSQDVVHTNVRHKGGFLSPPPLPPTSTRRRQTETDQIGQNYLSLAPPPTLRLSLRCVVLDRYNCVEPAQISPKIFVVAPLPCAAPAPAYPTSAACLP